MISSRRGARVGEDQVAERQHPHELLAVDDVDVGDGLGVALPADAADLVDGLPGLRVRREGHEVRRHQAAGDVLVVATELPHLLGGLRLEPLEVRDQARGEVLVDVLERVQAVVRVHLAEELGRLREGEAPEDLLLAIRRQPLEDVRSELVRERLDELRRQREIQVDDDLGDVLRMELLQRAVELLRRGLQHDLEVGAEEGGETHDDATLQRTSLGASAPMVEGGDGQHPWAPRGDPRGGGRGRRRAHAAAPADGAPRPAPRRQPHPERAPAADGVLPPGPVELRQLPHASSSSPRSSRLALNVSTHAPHPRLGAAPARSGPGLRPRSSWGATYVLGARRLRSSSPSSS
jgi:hypothetical protein